jgi:Protein of unknown function (DUF3775)
MSKEKRPGFLRWLFGFGTTKPMKKAGLKREASKQSAAKAHPHVQKARPPLAEGRKQKPQAPRPGAKPKASPASGPTAPPGVRSPDERPTRTRKSAPPNDEPSPKTPMPRTPGPTPPPRAPHIAAMEDEAEGPAELSIDPDYLRILIVKVRAFMGREATVMPDDASNPTEDARPAPALQEEANDLTREEVVEEIRSLSASEQAELVALMWLGRDDGSAEDWDELVTQARERRVTPTESYLLDHPLVAEYWLEGMDRLGLGGLVRDDTL